MPEPSCVDADRCVSVRFFLLRSCRPGVVLPGAGLGGCLGCASFLPAFSLSPLVRTHARCREVVPFFPAPSSSGSEPRVFWLWVFLRLGGVRADHALNPATLSRCLAGSTFPAGRCLALPDGQ